MADYGGFSVPSPQEVMARVQAQRDQFRQSGDPAVRRQATIDVALDAIFGNPQVRAAQKVQQALDGAASKMSAPGPSDSDPLTTELRRLSAMRDAVQDLDPAVASQINQQMLKIGAERLERQKLMADMERATAKEAREEAAAQRDSELHPFNIAAKATELQEKAAETVNYINPKTGDIVNINALDSLQVQALQQAGWVRSGINVQVDDPEKLGGLTKAATTDLQKSLIDGQSALDALNMSMQKFDPRFLELPTQVINAAKSFGERLGLPVQQSALRDQYYQFRANSVDALNLYINKITGAAMGVQEEVRIRRAFPDAEKDSATEFINKMRATAKNLMQVQRRAQQALSAGLTPTSRDQWEAIKLPDVSDAEVDQFLSTQFGLPARQAPRQQQAPQQQTGPKRSALDQDIDRILSGN